MSEPEPAPAWSTWSSLSDAQKTEVEEYARQGRRHPDEEIAATAEAYARDILSRRLRPRFDRGWDFADALAQCRGNAAWSSGGCTAGGRDGC